MAGGRRWLPFRFAFGLLFVFLFGFLAGLWCAARLDMKRPHPVHLSGVPVGGRRADDDCLRGMSVVALAFPLSRTAARRKKQRPRAGRLGRGEPPGAAAAGGGIRARRVVVHRTTTCTVPL